VTKRKYYKVKTGSGIVLALTAKEVQKAHKRTRGKRGKKIQYW